MASSPSAGRSLAVGIALALLIALAPSPAEAGETPANAEFVPVKRYDVLKKLTFPVVGVTKYWDGFGECRDRCSREHHGIDILTYGWKGLPVVAAHDGVVTKVTYDQGNAGCSVRIKGKDRWETRYYHLNNDVPGTDDKGFPCPAPGIDVGTQVAAGQVIGYIGDSGNSEDTVPHLHFELRSRSGYPIDPYRSLKKARRVVFEWLPEDVQATSVELSVAMHRDGEAVAIAVSADEVDRLTASERIATTLQAPVIAVDQSDPKLALDELRRLSPGRVVVVTDDGAPWLVELVRSISPIVGTAPMPALEDSDLVFEPDSPEAARIDENIPDRFVTLIAGRTDRIYRSYRDEYEDFVAAHRSLVIEDDRYAPRYVGTKTWNSPGRYADRTLLWWLTGDGWVGTESLDEAPSPGFAYVTERRALPWTLAHLGSVAELPPMPIWKSD